MLQKAEQSFLIKEINDEWRAPIQQQLTGAWDYGERLKMLDGDGIAAEVIFPDGITEMNTPPFGAGLGLSPRDQVPELQWAGAMAHNRWLAEFCANNPARHIGVASIPLLWDVQQAVEAVRWCVENGLSSVMIPTLWGEHDAWLRPEFGEVLAGQIPNAEFTLVPGAGHLPLEEQPDFCNREILRFLREGDQPVAAETSEVESAS